MSHPNELTLNFKVVHPGVQCCVLPADARNGDGNMVPNGTMVEQGIYDLGPHITKKKNIKRSI